MHTAFIDFKQAYDTIPRQDLWQHLQRKRMPASFLSIIHVLTLMNTFWRMERRLLECTLTRVRSRAALCPLCFSLCTLMMLMRLQRVFKALSQAKLVPLWRTCCMLMIWLWWLTILMRCRPCSTVCTECSEKAPYYQYCEVWGGSIQFIWFKCACVQRTLGECRLLMKIISIIWVWCFTDFTMSMIKSSKHTAGPLMASAFRVRQFVRENSLVDRPYVSL